MIYFTADEHIGHKKILEYCERPFKTVEHMEEVLVDNHNKLVKDADVVWHLGDVGWNITKTIEYINKLNGTHFLILGNHDPRKNSRLNEVFYNIYDTCLYKINGEKMFLSHYAHRVWPNSHRGSWHLYGHSHGETLPYGKSFDVGVDCIINGKELYRPISFDEIKLIMDKREIIGDTRHHIYQRLVNKDNK